MASLIDKLNPRRWWLWRNFRRSIENDAFELLPRPYDLGEIIFETRTGKVIPSPREGIVYSLENAQLIRSDANQSSRNSGRLVAGGEALTLYGLGVAEKMLAVDTQAYEAMSNLSQSQIENLSDLSSEFQNWDHSSWFGLSDGALNKFTGHLGEVYAADNLKDIGVSVQWPEASNQVGWDLLVAGHEVNVKTIADATDLHDHFARYPDVAALIPGDAHNIPADAFHLTPGGSVAALDNFLATHDHHAVIVDKSLLHTDVVRHAGDASDAALGSASVAEMHLPWVTIATSSWREFNLLNTAQTDMAAAAKNLSLDVAGRGGGAAVGAKGGAMLGGLLGPIGAAAGAIIGGIGGAIVGNNIAGSIKRQSLDAALVNYHTAKSNLQTKSIELDSEARNRYRSVRISEQSTLRESAQVQKVIIDSAFQSLLQGRFDLEKVPKEVSEKLLGMAEKKVASHHDQLLVQLNDVGFFNRRIWPTPKTISLEYAIAELEAIIALTKKMKANSGLTSQSALFSLLAHCGVAESMVRDAIKTTEDRRKHVERNFTQQISNAEMTLAKHRVQAFKRLAKAVTEIIADLQQKILPYVEKTSLASNEARIEMKKLGMS